MSSRDQKPKVYKKDQCPPPPALNYAKRVVLDMPLIDLLGLYGSVVLSLKHPRIGAYIRERYEYLKAVFAEALVSEGFPSEELDAEIEIQSLEGGNDEPSDQ
jgi:hypothetical protein